MLQGPGNTAVRMPDQGLSTEPRPFPKYSQTASLRSLTRVETERGRTFAWVLTSEGGKLLDPTGIADDRFVRQVGHGGTAGTDTDRLAYALSALLSVFVPFEPYCPINWFAGVVDGEPCLPQGGQLLHDEPVTPPTRLEPVGFCGVADLEAVDPLGQHHQIDGLAIGRRGPPLDRYLFGLRR